MGNKANGQKNQTPCLFQFLGRRGDASSSKGSKRVHREIRDQDKTYDVHWPVCISANHYWKIYWHNMSSFMFFRECSTNTDIFLADDNIFIYLFPQYKQDDMHIASIKKMSIWLIYKYNMHKQFTMRNVYETSSDKISLKLTRSNIHKHNVI